MNYEVRLESYSGPLSKLLELVEEKKMEITLVSLAEVTGDFLDYLKKMTTVKEASRRETPAKNHSLIADFLAIASKLLLIKSKILIPSLALEEEEKEDIKELERRLKIYQDLKKTQAHLKNNWADLPKMTSREFLMSLGFVFYPPQSLQKNDLEKAINKIFGELEKLVKPISIIKKEIVTLDSRIKEILKRLGGGPTSFGKLPGSKTRGELVALFLAVLHLLKDQLICVEQGKHFEDIKIVKSG